MRKECDRVRDVVSSAIKRFFREEQHFKSKFSIDALIGVTLEGNDMFYVTLNEVIDSSPNYASSGKKQRGASHNRSKTKTTRKDGQCTTLLDMQCHSASSPRGPNLGEVLSQSQEAASSTSDIHRSDFDDDNSSEGSDRNVAIKQEIDDSWYDNSQSGNDDEDHEMATDNFSYGQFSNIPDDSGTTSGPNIPISNTLPSSEGQTRCQESSAIASTSQTVSDLPLDPDGNILASTSTSNPSLPHPEGYEGPMPYVVPSIPRPSRRRSSLPLIKKVEMIRMSPGMSHRKLADIFGVSKTQVYLTLKRKEEILAACEDIDKHSKRIILDRQSKMHDVNKMTYTWYKEMMDANLPVSGSQLQRQAMYFAQVQGKSDFKASTGWLSCFKQRHGIGNTVASNSTSSTSQTEFDTTRYSVFPGMIPDDDDDQSLELPSAPTGILPLVDSKLSSDQFVQGDRCSDETDDELGGGNG